MLLLKPVANSTKYKRRYSLVERLCAEEKEKGQHDKVLLVSGEDGSELASLCGRGGG